MPHQPRQVVIRFTRLALLLAVVGAALPTSTAAAQAPGPETRVSFNRAALYFGALGGTNALRTPAQEVGVLFANGVSIWTVTSDSTWLDISPSSGMGTGRFAVAVSPGTYASATTLTALLTLTSPGVPNSPISLTVTLHVLAVGRSPFGIVDTPANNSTGLTGSIPVTGWAIDEIAISKVKVWRDPIEGEPVGNRIFVGQAVQVDGARPDVESTYAQPLNYQAGWGYMLLTNTLPNQGNGTFVLHVYAEDLDGHTVLIGSRTITCDNASATKPFGAIDTPNQGETISGTVYTNFGWALTPQPNTIPIDGSTILVYIDGVPVGRPTYNQSRSDIATLFPGRRNSDGAIGFFQFDTTTLASGVHTIAWSVSDTAGHAEGIGSRYFTVLNGAATSSLTLDRDSSVVTLSGGGADTREAAATGADHGRRPCDLAELPVSAVPVYRRTGFDPSAPLTIVDTDTRGVAVVSMAEAGRLALTLGSPVHADADGYDGYLVVNGTLAPLPAGAFLDRRSGELFWHPGVGFSGRYDLLFVRTEGGERQRIRVAVVIGPPPDACRSLVACH